MTSQDLVEAGYLRDTRLNGQGIFRLKVDIGLSRHSKKKTCMHTKLYMYTSANSYRKVTRYINAVFRLQEYGEKFRLTHVSMSHLYPEYSQSMMKSSRL